MALLECLEFTNKICWSSFIQSSIEGLSLLSIRTQRDARSANMAMDSSLYELRLISGSITFRSLFFLFTISYLQHSGGTCCAHYLVLINKFLMPLLVQIKLDCFYYDLINKYYAFFFKSQRSRKDSLMNYYSKTLIKIIYTL